MPLSDKVTVITRGSETITDAHACWGGTPPQPPAGWAELYVFTRPDEGSGPLDDNTIKTTYKVQGGALVKI
jgi:hypothetical protein